MDVGGAAAAVGTGVLDFGVTKALSASFSVTRWSASLWEELVGEPASKSNFPPS